MIKPAGRLVSYVLACALVCCASQALWAQADTVQSLAKRSGDANFASDVIKAAGSAANLAEAIRILESLAPLAKGAGATTVYSQLAVFLEMESRWNEASLAWESSARSSAASSAYSLTQAAVCALYDGDPLRAAKLVDEAKALGTGDAVHLSLISAYASFLSGDRPGSLKGALAVVSSGDSRYEPSALVLAS
ncbi:MAG TPA: hypothetical protein PLC54_07505, partial [Spirochaetales bacterium]|nr:hypothetical protein [Spirochaetales bacterium]